MKLRHESPQLGRSASVHEKALTRHFCGTCGGRLYTSGTLPGKNLIVQAGSLDDPDAITPQAVIYAKDAPAWDFFDPVLPRHEAAPLRADVAPAVPMRR